MISDYELAIVGAGPAGCSAAIYAGRAGIKTAIFDGGAGGGQLLEAPHIENYAGIDSITGYELAMKMAEQAGKYAELRFFEAVEGAKAADGHLLIKTPKGEYKIGALLIATGAHHRKLGMPSEVRLAGKGVSYCATCDGPLFKGKNVAVIGGGNTALAYAIYLKQVGCGKVTVIHRRDVFRAQNALVEDAETAGVEFLMNSVVEDIIGEKVVDGVCLKPAGAAKTVELAVQGVFVAIGEEPQNELAKMLGVAMNENGFILVDSEGRTNVKRVYAAGDVTAGLKQVITGAAAGARAALASTEVLGKIYPY